MKKLLACVLTMLMLLPVFSVLYAEDEEVPEEPTVEPTYIKELDMSLILPEELVVLTRDMDPHDVILQMYNFTPEELNELFAERSVYLNAIPVSVDFELIITMLEVEVNDFKSTEKSTLELMKSAIRNEYENSGAIVLSVELYETADDIFYCSLISQQVEDSTVYSMQYYTIVNDMAVNVTMQYYRGEPTQEDAAYLRSIIDTIVFSPELPGESEEEAAA